MMLLECLSIVAAICVNENAVIELHKDSDWTGATIVIDDVQITSMIASDVMMFPDRRRMTRYCVSEECIYYYLYCSAEGVMKSCTLSYNQEGDSYNRELRISASTYEQMETVSRRLRLLPRRGQSPFSISALSQRNSQRDPPYCRPSEDSGCR